jgi:hypothetical protein
MASNSSDVMLIREFVQARLSDDRVQERIRRNVEPRVETFSRELFWSRLIGCLLTTQQKSDPDSAVARFMEHNPFLLTLAVCDCANAEAVVHDTLVGKGLRFTTKIARQVAVNIERLRGTGWTEIENQFNELQEQKRRKAQASDYLNERRAADVVDKLLKGFGPKQSRNLWQWLGLARFEIPIDSRVMKWINNRNFSLTIEEKKLGSAKYHESVLDHIRALCAKAGYLPCELDAAIFWESSSPKFAQKTAMKKLAAREMKRLIKQGQFFMQTSGNRQMDSLELIWRRSAKSLR